MIDNTIPPVDARLLARAEGYTFKADDFGRDAVFAPDGTRIGGIYEIEGRWEGYGQFLRSADTIKAVTPLEAAVLLAEAHIEYTRPKTVERRLIANWAVVNGAGVAVAMTAFRADATRLVDQLRIDFGIDYKVTQLTATQEFTFDTNLID